MKSFWCLLILVVLMAIVEGKKRDKEEKPKCEDFTKIPYWESIDQGSNCGRSHVELSTRVMGGSEADLGEFPWMARPLYRSKETIDSVCGGSIIHKRIVVTAAHCCVGEMSREILAVRLGEHDNKTRIDCRRGVCAPKPQEIEVQFIVAHPEYETSGATNDICLLVLKDKIEFNDYVQPICLPTPCDLQLNKFENPQMVAAGWGYLDEVSDRDLDILQKVYLAHVPRDKCSKAWIDRHMGSKILPTQICAGRATGKDVCGGDSGGPLMVYDSSHGPSRYFLAGLVSYGLPCSQKRDYIIPGVYTNVASYLDWIFKYFMMLQMQDKNSINQKSVIFNKIRK